MAEIFNHHQAADLAKANLKAVEAVAVGMYERLNAYKQKPNASTEYIAKAENEIAQLYQAAQQTRQLIDTLVDQFSRAQSEAYHRGQISEQRRHERLKRFGGLDPNQGPPYHKEALREYNIAHQRFIDNI